SPSPPIGSCRLMPPGTHCLGQIANSVTKPLHPRGNEHGRIRVLLNDEWLKFEQSLEHKRLSRSLHTTLKEKVMNELSIFNHAPIVVRQIRRQMSKPKMGTFVWSVLLAGAV